MAEKLVVQKGELESSNLASYSYIPGHDLLVLTFNNGSKYLYPGVPASVVEGMKTAESVGKYFHVRIKNHFDYVRLDEL